MGQNAKWEYFRAIYERYRQADRKHALCTQKPGWNIAH